MVPPASTGPTPQSWGAHLSGPTCIRNMCNVWISSQLLKTAMAHPVFQNCRGKKLILIFKRWHILRDYAYFWNSQWTESLFSLSNLKWKQTTISSIFTGTWITGFSYQRNLIQLFTMFEILRFFPKPLAIQLQNLAENREILFFDKSDALDFLSVKF